MPRYQERAVAGAEYLRWVRFSMQYPASGAATLAFGEESVVELGDREPIRREQPVTLMSPIDNFGTFPLVNLLTGQPLGTTMTHFELLQAINSLYLQKAAARDAVG